MKGASLPRKLLMWRATERDVLRRSLLAFGLRRPEAVGANPLPAA